MTAQAASAPDRSARTPPLLLLAGLLFWGWQSGYWQFGAIMGIVLESARFKKVRWDVSEEDFRRIRNFCALLGLAVIVYIFSTNDDAGGVGTLFHANTLAATRYVGLSATAFLRWLPIVLFLFVAAQFYSEREAIPLVAISWFFRNLRKERGGVDRTMDVSYPYFMVCLFSAGIHTNDGGLAFFWGLSALTAWALWPRRTARFGIFTWVLALAVAVGIGMASQRGLGQLQRILEGYNVQWMANLMRPHTDPAQSFTAIGEIGRLKLSSEIVIRLEPKPGSSPPDYLREASYRRYTTKPAVWHAGNSTNFLPLRHEPGNESAWPLLRAKTNAALVTIASYLNGRSRETGDPEGLLPLPTGTSRLEKLPVFSLKKNDIGAVLATGFGLVIYDATFGPGATIDSPPDASTNRLDLAVPTDEAPALQQVISEMKVSTATEEQKLTAVQRFFMGNFSYSTWLGPDKTRYTNDETALARFLLRTRSGHCEYFATATVLLLRELGIPARYAVGYFVHEPSGHGYVVRERDAHAWCLVWNSSRQLWENFDTTPPSWVGRESARASAMQWLSDVWSWIHFQFARIRWGQGNLREYILWGLIPILALLLYQIIFRRGRKRRNLAEGHAGDDAPRWPGLDSEFYRLERELATRGVPRQPGETLSGWLSRPVADSAMEQLREPIENLLRLHYAYRFDPSGLSLEQRAVLSREVKNLLDRLPKMERRG